MWKVILCLSLSPIYFPIYFFLYVYMYVRMNVCRYLSIYLSLQVYAKCLAPDIEYKTVSVQESISSRELVKLLLSKYRYQQSSNLVICVQRNNCQKERPIF